jgi:hypothetical protein
VSAFNPKTKKIIKIFKDIEIHRVEIADIRKLKDFQLICNYLSFLYATITILGIFLTLSMTLIDRTWPGKFNGIGFRATYKVYTRTISNMVRVLFVHLVYLKNIILDIYLNALIAHCYKFHSILSLLLLFLNRASSVVGPGR